MTDSRPSRRPSTASWDGGVRPEDLAPEIRVDCVHYRGDRPCRPHKEHGVVCADCEYHEPQGHRVLMIKLDAMGDVLRTTCVLPALAEAYPGMHLTWITAPASTALFQANPHVRKIVPYGPEAMALLAVEGFDLAINLDTSPKAATLMSMARADRKKGYFLSDRGEVLPCSEAGVNWLRMGLFDELKKANERTYQDLMHEILELDGSKSRYVFELEPEEVSEAKAFLRSQNIRNIGRPLVGLNTGAGGRWQYKRWTFDGFVELIYSLKDRLGANVILLGGETEQKFNEALIKECQTRVYTTGVRPLRPFAAIVGECDVVVTGDTLGMHIAIALGCNVVTLFGPTSQAEIELYGKGVKLAPEMDCLVCYLERCDKNPACMDLISPETVYLEICLALADHPAWPGRPADPTAPGPSGLTGMAQSTRT